MRKHCFSIFLFCIASLQAHCQRGDFANVNFRRADSVAEANEGHPIQQHYALALKLSAPFSRDIEKFRAIYTWVCKNVKNDYGFSVENRKMRDKYSSNPEALAKWSKDFSRRVFQRLAEKNSTVCTGYAWLVKEMAVAAGIQCKIVDGYARTARINIGGNGTPNHSWNAVQLDSKWYLCDPTWSSGSVDITNHVSNHQFDDSYFLPSPDQFVRDHYPVDTSMILMKLKPTLGEFLNRPLIYRGAYQYEIKHLNPDTFNVDIKRGDPIVLSFNKRPTSDNSQLIIRTSSKSGETTVLPTLKNDSGDYVFEHRFTSKGQYDVHLTVNEEFVLSYAVRVR